VFLDSNRISIETISNKQGCYDLCVASFDSAFVRFIDGF
jgi:hypothetical protein